MLALGWLLVVFLVLLGCAISLNAVVDDDPDWPWQHRRIGFTFGILLAGTGLVIAGVLL